MDENKRIVEINGIKVEVDLRTAKRVDQFKVGDSIKFLKKEYSSYTSYPAVIVGFDEFKNLPTLIVAYINESYSETSLKFEYVNAKTEDCEIAPAHDFEFKISKAAALEKFENEIQKQKRVLADIEAKQAFFIKYYSKYFEKFENEGVNND